MSHPNCPRGGVAGLEPRANLQATSCDSGYGVTSCQSSLAGWPSAEAVSEMLSLGEDGPRVRDGAIGTDDSVMFLNKFF